MARRKARKRGAQLTNADKELIVQAYAITGNKSQVVRMTSFSRPTVQKVLREAESNKELQKARTRALEDLAGQVHGKTNEILESIGPEDLESGRQLRYNAEGEVVGKVEWGPSLMQKVTAAAILTDKLKAVQETKQIIAAEGGADQAGLPLPGTVQESLRLLGNKVKRLRMLDVQFEDKQPDLTERIQAQVAAAEAHPDVDEADYEEIRLEDFDNAGRQSESS